MSLVVSWCEGKLVMKQSQEMVEFQMVVLRVRRIMDFWIFIDGWENRWVKSDWKKDENMAGEWNFTSSKWDDDANDKDLLDSKILMLTLICLIRYPNQQRLQILCHLRCIPEFSNKGKILVFQFNVKHEQTLDCGGGYMKLRIDDVYQKNFYGDTP
ncbi:hypothetical protein MKW92_051550 [Papaver armeniacum]|nr:hypothetical protein MKW92_051550 [Papaver armeniacum]